MYIHTLCFNQQDRKVKTLTILSPSLPLSLSSSFPLFLFLPSFPPISPSISLQDPQAGVSVVLLEAGGAAMVAHCVARWLVAQALPPSLIATLPSHPEGIQHSGESYMYVTLPT